MRWVTVLFITLVVILAASGFRTNLTINTKTARELLFNKKKFLGIRCNTFYTPSAEELIPPLTGWGNYSWKITTRSDSAQFYFNQGINMYYAFHIIEARASFDKVIHIDPSCAMGWWGKALAFGPNINDFGYQRPSEAYPSSLKANELKNTASPVEKALIEAMMIRYSNDSTKDQNQLNTYYKDQMQKVYFTYGNNADVAALYADALMLLHPWDLYKHDFSPKPWTPEIVAVIKNAFTINPKHPGAHHYYVHALEASANPGEALKSAEFLCRAMPEVAHLTHMPSHIYIRTGYYSKGIEQNDKALKGYEKYLHYFAPVNEGAPLYSLHNTHMKVNCAQMAGSYGQAISAAIQLKRDIPVFYLSAPGALGNYIQFLYQSPLFTNIRFGKWKEILAEKTNDSLLYSAVLQHFGNGIAYARLGRQPEAKNELQLLKNRMENSVLKEPLVPFNSAYDALVIARDILTGVIAEQEQSFSAAISILKDAVKAEDNLIYNEPRDWILPARQYLGNALLKAGKYQEAIDVFNHDLAINPNNGWDLTGIAAALKKMHQTASLQRLQNRISEAWLIKDVEINSAVF